MTSKFKRFAGCPVGAPQNQWGNVPHGTVPEQGAKSGKVRWREKPEVYTSGLFTLQPPFFPIWLSFFGELYIMKHSDTYRYREAGILWQLSPAYTMANCVLLNPSLSNCDEHKNQLECSEVLLTVDASSFSIPSKFLDDMDSAGQRIVLGVAKVYTVTYLYTCPFIILTQTPFHPQIFPKV